MFLLILRLVIVFVGLVAAGILFYKIPKIPHVTLNDPSLRVSVIIPCRNEEHTIGLLLQDLMQQTLIPHEVIVVDDDSTDKTVAIAKEYPIRILEIKEKAKGWIGKSWALWQGSQIATGEVYLFLDSDVRLDHEAIMRLASLYQKEKCTISVQPYHATQRAYEQLSLPFNLIQIAANQTAIPKQKPIGCYGPIILISKKDYFAIGGHESVKDSIVEDMSLGQVLRRKGLSFQTYVGDVGLNFRMYPLGIKTLIQGWTKNMAAGAMKTPFMLSLGVFFFIASILSGPIQIVRYSLLGLEWWALVFGIGTRLWIPILRKISHQIGHNQWGGLVLYPIIFTFFVVLFTLSLVKKIFKRPVIWKDRTIRSRNPS
ncbi:MAG: glycosyltransferase family 2 protein [Bacilli bacterium]|nr:glycosyltransferase family 2 protein [Bacilli bacterium]